MTSQRDSDENAPRSYLTAQEAAEYLRVSMEFLKRRRIAGKDGPPFLRLGGRVVYRRTDVDRWAAGCIVNPSTEDEQ